MNLSRRQLFQMALPALAVAQSSRPLNVVCVGGHPDDPESGCGGTLAHYVGLGHRVTILYLTRGEAGIQGKSRKEAADIRSAEAAAACKILGARHLFGGQIDGATVIDKASTDAFAKILLAEDPDLVFTQWPLDTHMDHQAASLLTFRAWKSAEQKFALFYYEVELGAQTLGFHPTDYVDITSVQAKKRAAVVAHKSQDGERLYSEYHAAMEDFRGREAGCIAAEGFVHLARVNGAAGLPGLGLTRRLPR
jgi:LmbE family N-acetylglucosaminyl deacetylase